MEPMRAGEIANAQLWACEAVRVQADDLLQICTISLAMVEILPAASHVIYDSAPVKCVHLCTQVNNSLNHAHTYINRYS